MSEKPSYLGLLNAIAVGERGGEELFEAWAAATPNDDVRCVLQTVALREGEHSMAFAKRINELGYSVQPREDEDLPRRVALAKRTDLTDCEKFERLGFNQPPKDTDIFSNFFNDLTMDIQTGELMGRYVAEERDTGRKLRACYAELQGAAASNGNGHADLTAINERLERIECALAELAASATTSSRKK
jgi:hypothetical protein